MKSRQVASLLLATALTMGMAEPAGATNLTTAGGSVDSKLQLEVVGGGDPVVFSATVPAVIPIVMNTEGKIAVPSNLAIKNNVDSKAIEVTGIEVTVSSDWQAVEFQDTPELASDDKTLALKLRSDTMQTDGSFNLTSEDWEIAASGELGLWVEVQIPPQSSVQPATDIASISFTMDWAGGNGGGENPDPEPSPNPSNKHTITVSQGEHGTVDDFSSFETDEEGKITNFPSTTPDQGYIFDHWEDSNGNIVDENTIFDGPATIKPVFIQDTPPAPTTITITLSVEGNGTINKELVEVNKDSYWGEISGTLTAEPEGVLYQFDGWYNQAGEKMISSTQLLFPQTITAKFSLKPASPANWFTTNGTDTITGLSDTYLNMIDAPTELVIPRAIGGTTIKSIGANAFKGKDLISQVIIPDSVTGIQADAFSGCTGIQEIVIPDSVKMIGASAFSSCNGLKVSMLSDVAIGQKEMSGSIGGSFWAYVSPFYNTDGVEVTLRDGSVNIPSGLLNVIRTSGAEDTSMRYHVATIKNLTVNIPNSVQTVHKSALWGMSGITLNIDKPEMGLAGAYWGARDATVNWLR